MIHSPSSVLIQKNLKTEWGAWQKSLSSSLGILILFSFIHRLCYIHLSTVPYLIDGNNLLGHITSSSVKDSHAKHDLVLKLRTFQRLKRTRIILVFDGYPDPNLPLKTYRGKKFLVLFPPLGQNADQVIKDIILKQTDLRRFFVVSSDREIKNFAQANKAKTLKCEDFSRQLGKTLKEAKKAREEEKKALSPSPLEVDQWLEIFKDKND